MTPPSGLPQRPDMTVTIRSRRQCFARVGRTVDGTARMGVSNMLIDRMPLPARRFMPTLRFHIRHLCRTYYLSEWWDE